MTNAPMPGPLYRMHGASTGAYDIRNLVVTNRIVLTNKAPAALIEETARQIAADHARAGTLVRQAGMNKP